MIAAVPLLLAAQAAAAPSMIVSAEQLSSALGTCRDQIARAAFAGEDLAGAGWPVVMSQGPDDAGYLMKTYRHPTTMLMVALVHDPARQDQCVVMTPVGSDLTPQVAAKQADAVLGQARGGQWRTDAADVRQEPLGGTGLRLTFVKRPAK